MKTRLPARPSDPLQRAARWFLALFWFPFSSYTQTVEVTPAVQRALVTTTERGWITEWISEKQQLAVTSESLSSQPYLATGRLHVWSLNTGRVVRSIDVPGTVQVILGDTQTPVVIVAGGPFNKNSDEPFVWMINLRTGKILHKMPVWPADENGYLSVILSGTLDSRNQRFILHTQSASVFYDLKNPASPPGSRKGRHTPASRARSLPSFLVKCGVSDGGLVLNSTGDGAGVWRTDTWEQILQLGYENDAVNAWVMSADGRSILSIRPDASSDHLIWDLETLDVRSWNEPDLVASCLPVFVPGSPHLRFARATDADGIEFVTRNWRTGSERVDARIRRIKTDRSRSETGTRWLGLNAEFSDNGRALASSGEKQISVITWPEDPNGKPTGLTLKRKSRMIAGISNDGETVFFAPDVSDEKGDPHTDENHSLLAGQHRNGKVSRITTMKEVYHYPVFGYESHPTEPFEVITSRVTGASLGPYAFRILVRTGGAAWRQLPDARSTLIGCASFVNPVGSRKPLLVTHSDDAVRVLNAGTGAVIHEELRKDAFFGGDRRLTAPLGGRVLIPVKGGGARLCELAADGSLRTILQLWSPEEGSWLAILPDGRYTVSTSGKPPVYFRNRSGIFPIEDLDLQMNQPDAVARALGIDADIVAEFKEQRRKRILRTGDRPFDAADLDKRQQLDITTAIPLTHDRERLDISVNTRSRLGQTISSLNLFVNDVPVLGREGRPATGQATSLSVPLTFGTNKVQIVGVDKSGVPSLSTIFHVHRSSRGMPSKRYILAIGVADYENDELDLTYAAKDARDVARALGRDREHEVLILSDRNARRQSILEARTFLRQSKPGDEVFVFLSGHGDITDAGEFQFCPTDFSLETYENGITFRELEGLFEGIPALNRMLLVDACHSGELGERDRGELLGLRAALAAKSITLNVPDDDGALQKPAGKPRVNRSMKETFQDLRRTVGATVLSASAGAEFAFESAEHKNGLFTHVLLSVLDSKETDTDGDGAIRASELTRATSNRVTALTEGAQTPNARFVNLVLDMPVQRLHLPIPPDTPEELLRQFYEWSGGFSGELNPRVLDCFAPSVLYFGKQKSRQQIEKEERAYCASFDTRRYQLENVRVVVSPDHSTATLDFHLHYSNSRFVPVAEARRLVAKDAKKKSGPRWIAGFSSKIDPTTKRKTHDSIIRKGGYPARIIMKNVNSQWLITEIKNTAH